MAVFCKGEEEKSAKAAGADIIGGLELIEKVAAGFMDFDAAVATPDIMKDLSRLGKVLGPKGLMPSPKTGTVTVNVGQAVKDIKGGKIEFKTDKQAGLHVGIGKINFWKARLWKMPLKLLKPSNRPGPRPLKASLLNPPPYTAVCPRNEAGAMIKLGSFFRKQIVDRLKKILPKPRAFLWSNTASSPARR